jgi:hypothetical protein
MVFRSLKDVASSMLGICWLLRLPSITMRNVHAQSRAYREVCMSNTTPRQQPRTSLVKGSQRISVAAEPEMTQKGNGLEVERSTQSRSGVKETSRRNSAVHRAEILTLAYQRSKTTINEMLRDTICGATEPTELTDTAERSCVAAAKPDQNASASPWRTAHSPEEESALCIQQQIATVISQSQDDSHQSSASNTECSSHPHNAPPSWCLYRSTTVRIPQ